MTKRIISILVVTFVFATVLLGFQTELEAALSGTGFMILAAAIFGPILVAAYNNCKAVLRRQGLTMHHTRTYIGRH